MIKTKSRCTVLAERVSYIREVCIPGVSFVKMNHLAVLPSLPTLPSPEPGSGPLSSRFVQVVKLLDLQYFSGADDVCRSGALAEIMRCAVRTQPQHQSPEVKDVVD